MWNPEQGWRQQGSFVESVTPPAGESQDGPLLCLPLNPTWLPYILGALAQLVQPTTWDVATPADLEDIQGRVTDLIAIWGNAMPCGTTIPPIGPGGTQQACNISGYLANMVIRQALIYGINAIQQNQTTFGFALAILRFIPGGVNIAYFMLLGLQALYTAMTSGTLTDYQDAIDDPLLFGEVACAIYSAIAADGQVTQGNFPTLVANVGAVSYTHADVISAIVAYLNGLGASGLMGLQVPGVLNTYDCSGCGHGGGVTGPPNLPPYQEAGTVVLTITAGNADASVGVSFLESWPSAPLLTLTADSQQVIASYSSLSQTGFDCHITAAVPLTADLTVHVSWLAQLPGVL